jgi:hypothetical protein
MGEMPAKVAILYFSSGSESSSWKKSGSGTGLPFQIGERCLHSGHMSQPTERECVDGICAANGPHLEAVGWPRKGLRRVWAGSWPVSLDSKTGVEGPPGLRYGPWNRNQGSGGARGGLSTLRKHCKHQARKSMVEQESRPFLAYWIVQVFPSPLVLPAFSLFSPPQGRSPAQKGAQQNMGGCKER